MVKVICNKAGASKFCKSNCLHSEPHEFYVLELQQKKCTMWGDCFPADANVLKVRCVEYIKKHSAKRKKKKKKKE